MGLNLEEVQAFQGHWTKVLRHDHRKIWPKYLFRHDPLVNAVKILNSNTLESRQLAQPPQECDIAARDVLSTNEIAHSYARLYFRPRNPTQFSIEGVFPRAQRYRENAHAAILVLFVFDSLQVLTLPDAEFSNGNMQAAITEKGSTKAFFDTINFNYVYHDMALYEPEKQEVVRSRCAEVLIPNQLSLGQNLKAVICRSQAERETLLDELSPDAREKFENIIRPCTVQGMFFNRGAYIVSVDIGKSQIKVIFNRPYANEDHNVILEIFKEGSSCGSIEKTLDLGRPWAIGHKLEEGSYSCIIKIEGELSYKSAFSIVDDDLF